MAYLISQKEWTAMVLRQVMYPRAKGEFVNRFKRTEVYKVRKNSGLKRVESTNK